MSRPPLSQPAPSPAAAPRPPAARPQPRWPRVGLAAALLEALPLLVPALLAGFSLVAMILLQLGQFRPVLVLPLGAAAAVLAARGVALVRPEPLAGPRWVDGAALLAAIGFAAVNFSYSAQNLDAFRDPTIYAITGQWLQHHASLPIPVHPEVFGPVSGVSFFSQGFDPSTTPGFLHPQFGNLLAGLLAVGGWLGGDHLVLKLNPLIGGAALLVLYGLARQYAGRVWALVAVLALGVSMPQLHFSRNAYSEPVTMLFLLGGLALLREAQVRRKVSGYGLAGLVLGAAVLARIDGFFFLLAIPMYAAVALAAAPAERRRESARQVGALLLGVAVPAAVAMANLVKLSPDYLHNLSGELARIAVAGVAIVVVGAAAVVLAWRTGLLQRIAGASSRWLPAAGAAVVIALAVVAASRPLWYVAHDPGAGESYTHYIGFLQKARGLRLDPTRTYAEQSLEWFSWYWGPVTVALGVLGAALGAYWLLKRGDLLLVAPLGMFLTAALLYVTVPSITPDQIWAMRRYLPVVIPGLLVAAATLLSVVARRARWAALLAGLVACVMIWIPVQVSSRLFTVRDGVPQLVEVQHLCRNLPADAAVVLAGGLVKTYQQTVRSYCHDVPVAGLVQPSRAQLAAIRAAALAHGRRLYVVVTTPEALPPDAIAGGGDAHWQPISCVGVSHWNALLERAPVASAFDKRTIYVGVATAQGTVTLAPPVGPQLVPLGPHPVTC